MAFFVHCMETHHVVACFSILCPFLLLRRIQLSKYTNISLSIVMLVSIEDTFRLWLLWIKAAMNISVKSLVDL